MNGPSLRIDASTVIRTPAPNLSCHPLWLRLSRRLAFDLSEVKARPAVRVNTHPTSRHAGVAAVLLESVKFSLVRPSEVIDYTRYKKVSSWDRPHWAPPALHPAPAAGM